MIGVSRHQVRGNLQDLDSLLLVSLCVQNTQDTAIWSEFVRRFTPKIRQFIRGTLRQSFACGTPLGNSPACATDVFEKDLVQDTIVRLVDNDCAALKRFSGTLENDFHAYLAVICRSVVRDFLRNRRAAKRFSMLVSDPEEYPPTTPLRPDPQGGPRPERKILADEVVNLSRRTIFLISGDSAERNWLIFQLYYYHNLSAGRISRCKGIDLSKAGVERIINQVKERVRTMVSAGGVIQ